MKIKSSRNEEITLSFTDIARSCPSRTFLASLSFNAIRENKILAKISEFTVIKNDFPISQLKHILWVLFII